MITLGEGSMSRQIRIIALVLFSAASSAFADADAFKLFREQKNISLPGKFTFIRIEYDSEGGYGEAEYDYDGRHWLRWETDYPEADENFIFRVSELTTIDPNPRAETRRLTDPDLFEFPFIYMCDVGWMRLKEEEKAALRKYLNNGGFLWVDDFWGDAEWDQFEQEMRGVFPDRRWQVIPKTHPILKVVFPLEDCPQVPARDFALQGWKFDPPGIHKGDNGSFGATNVDKVHLRGWFDDKGELMVVCTHNTDLGDGFEREGFEEWYFETYSKVSYAMGINILVYALSH